MAVLAGRAYPGSRRCVSQSDDRSGGKGKARLEMISAYCCCLGDESEHAAEVPLAQVLPDKHEAADLFAATEGHAPEVGFFVVPSLRQDMMLSL